MGLKSKKPIRSITEILKESDKTDSLKILCDLWQEIRSNIYSYPLVEIEFSLEHLQEKAAKMARKDIKEFKPFFDKLNRLGKWP